MTAVRGGAGALAVDEEAACSADYDEAGSTSLLDAFDEAIRSADDLTSVVGRRPTGRDDGVRALDALTMLAVFAGLLRSSWTAVTFLSFCTFSGVRAAATTV